MFQGQKVIDVHGHMTTPAHFRGHLGATISLNTPGRKLEMPDEALANAQKSHRSEERRVGKECRL